MPQSHQVTTAYSLMPIPQNNSCQSVLVNAEHFSYVRRLAYPLMMLVC